MEEDSSKGFVDDVAMKFGKSLKELRELSCQLYNIADYCERTFCNSRNKTCIVDNTREYVSQAVVTVVDHLGSISATLELSINSNTNSIPETQRRIYCLKQRMWTCQQHSHKLALARFRWNAEFSRFHCRYIWFPPNDSPMMGSLSRDFISCSEEAYNEEGNQIEAKKPTVENKIRVLPVHDDELRTLPKAEQSMFRLQQESRKPKRSAILAAKQNRQDLAALLMRRGKRIILA